MSYFHPVSALLAARRARPDLQLDLGRLLTVGFQSRSADSGHSAYDLKTDIQAGRRRAGKLPPASTSTRTDDRAAEIYSGCLAGS